MKIDVLWTLRGRVDLDATPDDEVIARIRRMLGQQEKPVREDGPRAVGFREGLLEGPFLRRRGALTIFDTGRFWIEDDVGGRCLRYEVACREGLFFCAAAGGAFALIWALGAGWIGVMYGFALGVGWIFGMNRLIAALRVPRLIRRTALRGQVHG